MGRGDYFIEEKRPVGRPSNFTTYMGDAIAALIAEGLSERKIAKILKIHYRQITRWKNDFPEFCRQCEQAKDYATCEKIERSQFKLAVGFRYTEKTKELAPELDEDGKPKYITTKKVSKYSKPSAAAGQFLLTNLNPKRFKVIRH